MRLSTYRQEIDEEELSWLRETPVFCFTSDIEWSPEWAIQETLGFFFQAGIPLTPFLTHESPTIRAYYGNEEHRARVGLHPNFLPGSSHGATVPEVIRTVRDLWPEATGFRSHCFFDHSRATSALWRAGFSYDSNLGLFFQPACMPLYHLSGLTRYPVFWEDDDHFGKELPCRGDWALPLFEEPGLKVCNTHPLMFALNVPDQAFFQDRRRLYDLKEGDSWRASVHTGTGIRTFLSEVVELVLRRNYPVLFLHDLHEKLKVNPERQEVTARGR